MHKHSNEFGFLSDPTSDRSYLSMSAKKSTYYLVADLAPSFLIGSSSFLKGTRTTDKSGHSSNFGQIAPRAAELTAF